MKQKKILFYVHDGSGIGHLRRLSRVAAFLQGKCACLIITGQRDALWVIDDACELIYLPHRDSLRTQRAKYRNGKAPWMKLDEKSAIEFRSNLLCSIVEHFNPDAIIVDYLPFGKNDEIKMALQNSESVKYLIHRGIVDPSDRAILCGNATREYSGIYDKIIIAADEKIVDLSEIYEDELFLSKTRYVGYVVPQQIDRERVRYERNVRDTKWVVCSAGGGIRAEEFLLQCVELSRLFSEIEFDLILGPRSKLEASDLGCLPYNLRVHKTFSRLAEYNAACDLAIINGGYNSLMEAASGGAEIMVYPNQSEVNCEQIANARKFSAFYPVTLVEKQSDFMVKAKEQLAKLSPGTCHRFEANTNGLEGIKEIIFRDLMI